MLKVLCPDDVVRLPGALARFADPWSSVGGQTKLSSPHALDGHIERLVGFLVDLAASCAELGPPHAL